MGVTKAPFVFLYEQFCHCESYLITSHGSNIYFVDVNTNSKLNWTEMAVIFSIVMGHVLQNRCSNKVKSASRIRAPSQYQKRRLFVRSRKVSKPRDWYFKLAYRFEIWQAHRQHCCRSACQISERSDDSKYKSRGFETLRDLTERRLFGYWDGAQTPWYQEPLLVKGITSSG